MLATARAYQQPPTAWVGGDGEWTDRDRTITLAHTIYEASLCPECGYPREVCRSGEAAFEVAKETCHAREAIDQLRQERAKTNTDPDPGEILVPTLDDEESEAAPNPFKK